jgi:hypothetical protein
MADEIDRGQANDEVATRGQRSNARSPGVSELGELGVSSQRVSEWRDIRDAGEPVVEGVITRALDEGRVPTKSEILEAARQIRAERQGVKAERRAAREVDLANRITALPQRRYGVIVADPEWRFEPWSRQTGMDRAADNHYPTSCTEIIAARDVPSIAADDCILFLWATVPMLLHALTVMGGWGFDYRSHYVWVKNRIGTGYWNRNKHELLLVGVRGHIPAPAPGTGVRNQCARRQAL